MPAEGGDPVGERAHGGRAFCILARFRRLLGLERSLQVGDEALALLRRFEGLDQAFEGLGVGRVGCGRAFLGERRRARGKP